MKTALFFAAALAVADPISDIARAQEINLLVHESITYVATPFVIKTPAQTFLTGGDCADMSAYIIWLLEDEGIHGAEMLLLDLDNYVPHHAIVRLWGVMFDPVSGLMFTDEFPLPHKMNHNVPWNDILILANWKHISAEDWEIGEQIMGDDNNERSR